MKPEEMKTAIYENDAEQARERIAQTFDDLQEKLSPRNLATEAVEALQDKGRDLVDGATARVKQHPVVTAVVAAAAGAAMFGRRKLGKDGDYKFDAYDDVYGDDMNDGVETASTPAKGEQTGVLNRARDRAGEARDYASEKLAAARERTSDYASRAKAKASKARRAAGEGVKENPLAVALVGVAAGALIGALLPRTRREDELLGEQRDRLVGAGKAAAKAAVDTAKAELGERGLTLNAAKAKLDEVGNHAKDVARSASKAAADRARKLDD
ncbi:DUF3618 domain-containing protein [Sphingoaurantiacus capsulatus]|uniref:DUF3618 domain-containing protein n=1 Tax=Sphingoaurantiacus capsulatus TaxID=1771310 RepID=A0ABV7XC08_9SPHN